MNAQNYYVVIMAGGGGTRLWPLSRQSRPKQMLDLFDEGTMFQIAVKRLLGLFPYERIHVVTIAEQAELLYRQVPELPWENFLIEPQPRGTASVIGMGAVAIQKKDPEAVMAVVTSDHLIQNEVMYHQLLKAAYHVAGDGYLVTLGITPTYPATGFGYIQFGQSIGAFQDLTAYRVQRFKEKPPLDQAKEMLASGDHAWNSGMFVWRVEQILGEFESLMPELFDSLQHISRAWHTPQQDSVVQKIWPTLKTQTIDYGIMEKSHHVAVLPAAGLGWNDVGTWESLFEVLPGNADGNIVIGADHLGMDTRDTLICSDKTGRLVVTIGVEGLVVVDTGDALMICSRQNSQKLREMVAVLKQENRVEFL
jgi:mannose-1-phosphate guanylyltransferase